MKKVKNINLPVSYSMTEFDNERFLKLRIKVMHTGLNLNNSNFDLEVIDAAKASLANIPLLAFIKKTDGEDNSDFAGHEYEIKITEDDMKFVYLGRPIGIIPESNNYEVVTDEDGKTYVYADAYVWKDYANSALDILDRDQVKKVSMEIIIDDYEWNESYVDIKAYKYTGIALLGEDVKEAMIGAKASVVEFSAQPIAEMMNELRDAMAEFAIKEISATPGASDSEVLDLDAKSESTPPSQAEIDEDNDEDDLHAPETDDDGDDEDEPIVEGGADEGGADEGGGDEPDPEIEGEGDPDSEEFTVDDNKNEQTQLMKDMTAKILELTEENNKLKEYKAGIEKREFENAKAILIEEFSDLEEEEINTVLAKDLEIEDLEIHLYALRGKKMRIESNATRMNINPVLNFTRTEKPSEPEYADLIREHTQSK